MKKILICGDSFAADWTVKYPGLGWPNLLANDYDVVNLAQAGVSEYKIYLQLKSVNLSKFDYIIVFHTSPNRVYIKKHPVHYNDPLHFNSDLIYNDIKEHSKSDNSLLDIVKYFESEFDIEYAVLMHTLLCQHIETILSPYNVIHATGINWSNLYEFNNMIDVSNIASQHLGHLNHFTEQGNLTVYRKILESLKQI